MITINFDAYRASVRDELAAKIGLLTCPACGRVSMESGCVNTPGCANYREPAVVAAHAEPAITDADLDYWEEMQEEEEQRRARHRVTARRVRYVE